MNKHIRETVITALIVIGFVAPTMADPINLISYDSIGPNSVDFEDLVGVPPPPLIGIFDGILLSRRVKFAERFVGQTLTIVPSTGEPLAGPLDELSGVPSDPLTLQPGEPNKNLAVLKRGEPLNNLLFPCGNLTCRLFAGLGEGAFALIFPAPVSAFGFIARGGDPGGDPDGDIVVQFFRDDGTLIAAVGVFAEDSPTVSSFGFLREDGITDIAGVSIHTTDPAGLDYDDFVFGEGTDKLLLAGTGNGPADPGTETTPVTEDVVATARLPLGSTFFLQLAEIEEETGMPLPVESMFTLEAASVTPAITDATLFLDSVVIEFDRAAASEIKFFAAVHLGSVRLNITPTDSSISPVSVQVTVTQPLGLGSSNNEFDELMLNFGHLRGIPPQFIKALARQESGAAFDPEAYRYELLSVDLRYMSRGRNLRTEEPFSLYRLATTDDLAQGEDIITDDISPRSIYSIRRDGTRRPIDDADEFVSALEIFGENDAIHRWLEVCVDCAEGAEVRENPLVLDFTAQTPIAASYGLLQMLYATAITSMNWPGVLGRQNPSLLFDTPENLEIGGGSLELGSDYLRRVFARANPSVSVTDPELADQMTFEIAFERAFNAYHGARNLEANPYGPSVLNFSQGFEPIPSTSIFP